jgi:hypothetical protein
MMLVRKAGAFPCIKAKLGNRKVLPGVYGLPPPSGGCCLLLTLQQPGGGSPTTEGWRQESAAPVLWLLTLPIHPTYAVSGLQVCFVHTVGHDQDVCQHTSRMCCPKQVLHRWHVQQRMYLQIFSR